MTALDFLNFTHQSSHSGSSDSGSVLSVDKVNSPQKPKNFPSPWAQVVRGGETESIPSPSLGDQSTFSDCSPRKPISSQPTDNSSLDMESLENNDNISINAVVSKKPAWKKPSNGLDISPVMGAVSWPALSESTKPSPKSSSSTTTTTDSSSPFSPAKIVVSPDGSMPTNQGHITTQTSHKQAKAMPARQRSMKRGGGGGSNSGGGHSQSSFTHPRSPPPPPPFPIFAMPPNGYGNLVPAIPDQSPREPPYRGNNNWEPRTVGGFVPQPAVVNDNRHSSRRGNFGPRGESSYHNSFGGRRDQDRGHYGNVKDAPVQPQRSPRAFVRPPPPNTASFVPPQPVRPFANPMGFPDLVYIPTLPMEPFRGVPFMTHTAAPAMIVPVPEPPLPAMLIHQIEYYFSDANLIKDDFLKSNMDDQGWVSITLIAGFNRVKSMTKDTQLILDSLRTSTVLEVQDDKVRRRNDWMKWISSSSRLSTDSALQSIGSSSHDILTNSFQNMTVEEVTSNQNSMTSNSQD